MGKREAGGSEVQKDVMVKARVGVMWPRAKGSQKCLETGTGKDRILP